MTQITTLKRLVDAFDGQPLGRPDPGHDAIERLVASAAETLDPQDWEEFSRVSHQALDMMIDYLRGVAQRPVWSETPSDVRENFRAPLPRLGRDFEEVLDDFQDKILPYGVGNGHPLFLGWVHGAGTPYGMIAEMLAAGLNANCGGRNHVAIDVERQVALWASEMFGYPAGATGLFVTGTSMANFLALLVARDAAMGHEVRRTGLQGQRSQLVVYASSQAHGCIRQATELSGIGSNHLRLIRSDAMGEMDIRALRSAIVEDRHAGLTPFLIVGSAGTVNTGAFDDLDAIADVAVHEGIRFHVDGAFGALAALSSRLKPKLKGIERSDSIAFDFHKWAHVPYDAGFLLVKHGQMHRETFSNPAAYLQRAPHGVGSGDLWPCDLGPDLSRGFRALKTWMTFQALGADRIARAIEKCCSLALLLESRLRVSPIFEPAAPVGLNIVCLKVRGAHAENLHEEIVMDLQERGIAVPSMTTLNGQPVIRVAIVNHRTEPRHIDLFLDEAEQSAQRLLR